jgi:magnesium transporter
MIHTYTWNKETWVDIDHGTSEEIADTVNTYDIDPYVARELVSPTPKSRIEFHKEYIYLILHFPVFKHTHGKENKQEIDFIIGKDFLLTAHYDTIDALHKMSKQFEVNEILSKKTESYGYHVFGNLFKELYSSLGEELAYMEDWTESITEEIFDGHEKEMVFEISEAIRTLLYFKKTTDSHKEILDFLRDGGNHIFGGSFSEEIESILLEYHRLRANLQSNLELLRELRETNNGLLTTKQTETMKTLTVFAFIGIPVTIITSMFGMNAEHMPFVSAPYGFYVVCGIMLVTGIIMYTIARFKKWL